MCIYIVWTVFFMENRRWKLWETAALLALCVTLCLGTWASAVGQGMAAGLVRLHVIAVSDDEAEQALKLRVRDAVLAYLQPKLEGIEDPAQARRILTRELPGIAAAAEQAAEGRRVSVRLGRENYPLRDYGPFRLPAGSYESLRVILGEGQGHNWWCVVFPPLCLEAVEAQTLQSVMTEADYAMVSGRQGYELRFWLVELWGELKNALS